MSRIGNTLLSGALLVGGAGLMNSCASSSSSPEAGVIVAPSAATVTSELGELVALTPSDIAHVQTPNFKVTVGQSEIFVYDINGTESPIGNADKLTKTGAAITRLTAEHPQQTVQASVDLGTSTVDMDIAVTTSFRNITHGYMLIGSNFQDLGSFGNTNKSMRNPAVTSYTEGNVRAAAVSSIDLNGLSGTVDGTSVKTAAQAQTTEFCQEGDHVEANITAAKVGGVPSTAEQIATINKDPTTAHFMQELVCNSFSRVIAFARAGESYASYHASVTARPLEVAQQQGITVQYIVYDELTYSALVKMFKS
jgi:hypothetical protein